MNEQKKEGVKITIVKAVEYEAVTLVANLGVRYWDDSSINGVDDDRNEPKVPCQEFRGLERRWKIEIDLATGLIKNWTKGVEADIHYKVCDDGEYTLLDAEGNEIISGDAYVPSFLGEDGDYVIFHVNKDGYIEDFNCTSDDLEELQQNFF